MKIAVLRANALGDFVVSLPALEALDAHFPEAEIVLLAKPWTKAYLEHRPSPIDRVEVIPVSRGVRVEKDQSQNDAELEQFFERMRHEDFDLAIQLHGGGISSNPFVKNLGAKQSIGLKTPEAMALDKWIPYYYHQAEILRYLEVLSLLNIHPVTLEPHIAVTSEDIAELEMAVGQKLPERFVVMHVAASDFHRHWPPAKFAAVADYVIHELELPVVLTGIASEAEVISQVEAEMSGKALNLCGSLSLSALTALLSKAVCMVGNDSGPLHLARAVKTPTLGIFWGPLLHNWGPLFKQKHLTVESWEVVCPECQKNIAHLPAFDADPESGCIHPTSFVKSVTVEAVIRAINLLYEQTALH